MTNGKKVVAINEYIRTQKTQKAAPRRLAASQQREALSRVLDELTRACILEVSGRTGVSDVELLRHIVRDWYNIQCDVPTGHLKWAIGQSNRDAAKWGTGTQG